MVPFARNDGLWRSGLAGAIPNSLCFILAGALLYAAARRIFNSRPAAAAAVSLFALNPNVLYLQSVPMTEMVFLCSLTGVLYFATRPDPGPVTLLGAALFLNLAALTRYEGWILIPLVAAAFAFRFRRPVFTLVFCLLVAAGPLFWLGYNWWLSGNPLEFYNGPYSARAINERAVAAGMARYPGDHDLPTAILYYSVAARLCAGAALTIAGLAGIVAACLRRALWPLLILAAPSAVVMLSMYGSSTPIFIPSHWPNTWYNTRYGLSALPLLAFAAGAIVLWLPKRIHPVCSAILVLAVLIPWLARPDPENWICWKESQVNSEDRRAWTAQASAFLTANYTPGAGIFTSFGDLTGIFQLSGIPLSATLYDGNNPQWLAAAVRPQLFLHEEWAVAQAGDSVAQAVELATRKGVRYRLVSQIIVGKAPVVEIYKRD